MSLSKLQELAMDMETWRATVHGVTNCQTWLSNWTELLFIHYWDSWSIKGSFFFFPSKFVREDCLDIWLVTIIAGKLKQHIKRVTESRNQNHFLIIVFIHFLHLENLCVFNLWWTFVCFDSYGYKNFGEQRPINKSLESHYFSQRWGAGFLHRTTVYI